MFTINRLLMTVLRELFCPMPTQQNILLARLSIWLFQVIKKTDSQVGSSFIPTALLGNYQLLEKKYTLLINKAVPIFLFT